jgi:hypothetical protein
VRFRWNNQTCLLLAIILFSMIGTYLVRASCGIDSMYWCFIYAVSDFDTLGKTVDYVANLRMPIPIVLSLAEIASYNVFGNTHLITHVCYRIALVLSFVVAIYLASSSKRKIFVSFALSVVFLWATVVIHPGNPQIYDIFLPLFSLLFVVFLQWGISRAGSSGSSKTLDFYCCASGFCLSMAELMRPFVILLVPVLLFCAYQALKEFSVRRFLYFLAPLALFSGTWHAYVGYQYGQVTWSNQSGFNLINAWPKAQMPELVPEINNKPLAPLRPLNFNTAEHAENSRRLQKAVLQYMLEHPIDSMGNVLMQVGALLFGKTQMLSHRPDVWQFWIYRPCVWLACVALFANAAMLCIRVGTYRLPVLGIPENMLIIIATSYIFLFAIGENGEQARFLLSILPLIAALPAARVPGRDEDRGCLPYCGADHDVT